MFINCTNHNSKNWSKEQYEAASLFGEVVDYPFPNVLPNEDEKDIDLLAENVVDDILRMQPKVVMCQGEFNLTYSIVSKLKLRGIRVVAACSDRITEEERMPDGSTRKIANFRFVKFREY